MLTCPRPALSSAGGPSLCRWTRAGQSAMCCQQNALSSAGAPSRRSTRARRAWPSGIRSQWGTGVGTCPRPAQLAGADLTNRLPPHCRLHCGARRRSTSSKICAPLGHDPAKAIARGILVGRGTSRCRWRRIARHRARHSARHDSTAPPSGPLSGSNPPWRPERQVKARYQRTPYWECK